VVKDPLPSGRVSDGPSGTQRAFVSPSWVAYQSSSISLHAGCTMPQGYPILSVNKVQGGMNPEIRSSSWRWKEDNDTTRETGQRTTNGCLYARDSLNPL
jgi:hypothetical protein